MPRLTFIGSELIGRVTNVLGGSECRMPDLSSGMGFFDGGTNLFVGDCAKCGFGRNVPHFAEY